jgi:uncharacterized membrane protein
MSSLLNHLVPWICGRQPDHVWMPDGFPLPCCQRCTGLYTGILIALLLCLWLRPRQTPGFLKIHGAFLLIMVPFGFHWVPQEAWIRTMTGFLFGAACVNFVWLGVSEYFLAGHCSNKDALGQAHDLIPIHPRQAASLRYTRLPACVTGQNARYFGLLGLAALGVPALASWGGVFATRVLPVLVGCGLVAALVLCVAGTIVLIASGVRSLQNRKPSALP